MNCEMEKINAFLRKKLLETNLNINQIHIKTGLSFNAIKGILNGDLSRNTQAVSALKIADALGFRKEYEDFINGNSTD